MRPTLALAVIAKNEEKNVSQLLESCLGCFDQIVFVDTGSTDRTVEIAEKYGCEVHHFKWINDFAAARNFAFSKVDCDFVAWLDLDDVLVNREAFIKWRDTAMEFADFWLASYDYAHDESGKPIVRFARERVFKMSKKPVWQYFVHEGVVPGPDWKAQYITTWHVKHMRDALDVEADRSRNISILEARKHEFDGRMWFYYGKELFEAKQFDKALSVLSEAATRPDQQLHDRVLALQYGAWAAQFEAEKLKPEHQAEKLFVAIQLAQQGLLLDPTRAEFYVIIGDSYCRMGKLKEALPYMGAAEHCKPEGQGAFAGAIYSAGQCYGEIPAINKAKIYFNLGDLEASEREAQKAFALGAKDAGPMLEELKRIKPLATLGGDKTKTQDIVFVCPPQTAYPFDEEIYQRKPLGGSETALVQVAKWLKKFTDRKVIVFNPRQGTLIADSGVEYRPASEVNEYFMIHEPAVCINWRHNIKLTNAPTYLWCHDLTTPTVESVHNFDKIMCLSPFHRDYVNAMQGVPEEKIMLTRNGIDPDKFASITRKSKDPSKIVWMSSPDRGLEQCMLVLDEVRKTHPDITLHVYYGLDNLYKYGLASLADKLKSMMAARPWVKYHGFTEQTKMYEEVSDAVVWCHPCNFIETFCITALEMLALGVFPIARKLGALKDTLSTAEEFGQAVLLSHGCETQDEIEAYAREVRNALDEKKWERVYLDPNTIAWSGVAKQWVQEMGL